MEHEIGNLPFEAEITKHLYYGLKNRITVAVDNTLLQNSVPQGRIQDIVTDNGTKYIQSYSFDFFNYAGIHRYYCFRYIPFINISFINAITSNSTRR